MNYWWVVASERDPDNGWHWRYFFDMSSDDGGSSEWGGSDWIKSSFSHRRIQEMRKGDLVVAYQAGEGVSGFTYLASDGYVSEYEGVYDCFDLNSKLRVSLNNPIPFSAIRALPDAPEHFEFVKFQQNTVFRTSPEGFRLLLHMALEENPKQQKEVERFLSKGDWGKLRPATADKLITSSVLTPPKRLKVETVRVVRDTAKSRGLKAKYNHRCQVCDIRIEVSPGRYYAEVHHIRPLGGDHKGLDDTANMIVVCPNHHAYFDLGVPRFLPNNEIVIGAESFTLTVKHELGEDNLNYHNREIFGGNL